MTILHVEKILNSITYCCTTTSFKTGVRIYQAQLFVDAVESRIKVSVDVQPPLLYNPQFGAELTYREGAEPVLLFPKLLFTASEKVIYKRGHVMVDFNDVVDDGFDRLDFAPKTGFTVQKSGQLMQAKEYLGMISAAPNGGVMLTLDAAGRVGAKLVQQILRSIAFFNTSKDPKCTSRNITASVNITDANLDSMVTTSIGVIAQDDPTEIHLDATRLDCLRDGPELIICQNAKVVDPDTFVFEAPAYVTATIKGGIVGSDIIGMQDLLPAAGSPSADEAAVDAASPLSCVQFSSFNFRRRNSIAGGAMSSSGSVEQDSGAPPQHRPSTTSSSPIDGGPPYGYSCDITALQPDGSTKTIATFSTASREVSATLALSGCSLVELQNLVQRFTYRAKSIASRTDNKQIRKLITFSCQSGSAPVFRTTLAVDVLPTLIDCPLALSANPIVTWRNNPSESVELYTSMSVPMMHFSRGGRLSVRIDMPDDEQDTSPVALELSKKFGVSVKEMMPAGGSGGTAATSSSSLLFVDNKKVGTFQWVTLAGPSAAAAAPPVDDTTTQRGQSGIESPGLFRRSSRRGSVAPPTAILGAPTIVSRVSFDIRVTAENSPLIFQKILRSVTFTSIRKLNQPTPVILFVADEARFLASWTFTVFVVPPETSRSLGFNDLTSMSWRGARSSTTPSSSSAPAAAAATAAVTAAQRAIRMKRRLSRRARVAPSCSMTNGLAESRPRHPPRSFRRRPPIRWNLNPDIRIVCAFSQREIQRVRTKGPKFVFRAESESRETTGDMGP